MFVSYRTIFRVYSKLGGACRNEYMIKCIENKCQSYPSSVVSNRGSVYRTSLSTSRRHYCETSKAESATYTQLPPQASHSLNSHEINNTKTAKFLDGPSLQDFILNDGFKATVEGDSEVSECYAPPYLSRKDFEGGSRSVFFETYGCQMNTNDTEIVWAILKSNGFIAAKSIKESDIILVMTCAIREGAEQKIWKRLEYFKSLKKARQRQSHLPQMKIGILGCMAERLKTKIIEKEKQVDLICGPDSYKDLPRMLAVTESGQTAVNVLLSLDETYADVVPVRLNAGSPSAFVSIMRGCDNMCSYCIVPFTRGRERSRPMESILEEVRQLSDQGVKEVTLLGQNVNSYRDTSTLSSGPFSDVQLQPTTLSTGFRTIYRTKVGGLRFSDLLDQVSRINPEMRIRFTSPHPKDFPDEVLQLIGERTNICRQLHLPAQSGSSKVLDSMRRGYTRDAYVDLVNRVREFIPDVALSSDFISGFCGETEDDHRQTVELMKLVKYHFAFCFPYSMRQKTHASHRLVDDVSVEDKSRRHQELVTVFREEAVRLHQANIGRHQLVLVEGRSKRSADAVVGRNESNIKVIVPLTEIPVRRDASVTQRSILPGDYVTVQINSASSQVLKGTALYHTTLTDYARDLQPCCRPTRYSSNVNLSSATSFEQTLS